MATVSAIREHHAHRVPHLARLQVLGSYQAGEPVPPGLAADLSAVTSAILAEAGAAVRATVAAVPGTRRTAVAELLAGRIAKLAAAAEQAACAAKDGDAAALRRCLRRFESLTSAVWTVQLAMPDGARLPQPAGSAQRSQGRLRAAGGRPVVFKDAMERSQNGGRVTIRCGFRGSDAARLPAFVAAR